MTFQVEEMYLGGKKTLRGKNCKQNHKAVILGVKGQWLKDSAGKIDDI